MTRSRDIANLGDGITTADIGDSQITDAKIVGMSSSKLSGALPAIDGSALTGLAGGTVKQIQGASQPVAGSATLNQSWGDLSGISVSITPESSSNKILLVDMVSISYNNNGSLRFTRNGTPIAVGNSAGSRQQTTTSEANIVTNGITYTLVHLDEPGTTIAITYKVQAWAYDSYGLNYAYGNNQDVNYRFRAISNIYAIEVE